MEGCRRFSLQLQPILAGRAPARLPSRMRSSRPRTPGPTPLRRLTNREYNNTVHDLLGDDTRPADQFPVDRDETFLFARAGAISVQDAKLLRGAAEALATAAVGKVATLVPCNPA